MTKIKVSVATDNKLNWMVAKCLGFSDFTFWHTGAVTTRQPNGIIINHNYSENWLQGGPIIEREKLATSFYNEALGWACFQSRRIGADGVLCRDWFGPTPLIAAMRCYVASKLGDEVEVPEELM